jgi:hypothetical protein
MVTRVEHRGMSSPKEKGSRPIPHDRSGAIPIGYSLVHPLVRVKRSPSTLTVTARGSGARQSLRLPTDGSPCLTLALHRPELVPGPAIDAPSDGQPIRHSRPPTGTEIPRCQAIQRAQGVVCHSLDKVT